MGYLMTEMDDILDNNTRAALGETVKHISYMLSDTDVSKNTMWLSEGVRNLMNSAKLCTSLVEINKMLSPGSGDTPLSAACILSAPRFEECYAMLGGMPRVSEVGEQIKAVITTLFGCRPFIQLASMSGCLGIRLMDADPETDEAAADDCGGREAVGEGYSLSQ
jgi:hypothetical protein